MIICSIIEVPTFFLPRLLLGSDKMHRGLTVHLCLHFPLFAALVLLLTANHQALAAPVSTGNFLSPQTVYSFLSMQFSSQWKPGPLLVCGGFMVGLRWVHGGIAAGLRWVCGGHPRRSRQLDLSVFSPHPLAWGDGERAGPPCASGGVPRCLVNCRVFSVTEHLSKADASFPTSMRSMGRRGGRN